MTLYFEDLAVGDRFDVGSTSVSEEEIIAFAEKFDPQPFHTDVEAARESMFGELVASGLHTLCETTGLVIREFISRTANMGARGMDELRWHRPVKPGDTLAVSMEVIEKAPSSSRSDRGYVDYRREVHNQDGDLVMTLVIHAIVRRRPEN